MKQPKTDNGAGAHGAKVKLRQLVLAHVQPAHVFDGFAGLGKMYEGAWHAAEQYTGCDERPLSLSEPHRRYVCDNLLLMRAIDLAQFNVFDFDAYGSPWDQMLVLAARRRWAPGERGAVVITDGASLKLRFGSMSHSMAQLMGMHDANALPASAAAGKALQTTLLQRWCERAGVRPTKIWAAEGNGSGRGGTRMRYTAVAFAGAPEGGAEGGRGAR